MTANKIFGGIIVALLLAWAYNNGHIGGDPAGPRKIVVCHHVMQDTQAVGDMIMGLRDGPQADYLKAKGHTLEILDADTLDEDGQPDVYTKNWLTAAGAVQPPFLGIKSMDDKVLIIRPLSPVETQTSVITTVQEYGGGF